MARNGINRDGVFARVIINSYSHGDKSLLKERLMFAMLFITPDIRFFNENSDGELTIFLDIFLTK